MHPRMMAGSAAGVLLVVGGYYLMERTAPTAEEMLAVRAGRLAGPGALP